MPLDCRPSGSSGLERLAARLREMFTAIAGQPAPAEMLDLVDQLDGVEEPGDKEPASRAAMLRRSRPVGVSLRLADA